MNNAEKLIKSALLEKNPIDFLKYKLSCLYVNAKKEREMLSDLWEIDVTYLKDIGFQPSDATYVNAYINKLHSKIENKSFSINDDGFWICRNWGAAGNASLSLHNAIGEFEFYKEYNEFDSNLVNKFVNVCNYFITNFVKLNQSVDELEIFSATSLINMGIIDGGKSLLQKRMLGFIEVFSGYMIKGEIPVDKYADLIIDTANIHNMDMLNGLEKIYGDVSGHGNLLLCKAIYTGSIDTINWLLPRLNSFSINYENEGAVDDRCIPISQRTNKHKAGIKAVDLIDLVWPDNEDSDFEMIEETKSKLEKAELFQAINASKNTKYVKSL